MRDWSFLLGKPFGVEVRMHLLFAPVFALCVLWASMLGHPPARGVLLCGLLLMAVLVREGARALMAAWCGLPVRGVLLLPTGGLLEVSPGGEPLSSGDRTRMALVGPVANFAFGAFLLGSSLLIAPNVDLVGQPWVTPLRLIRSAVWLNLLLGAVNLLPAWPLDGDRALNVPSGGNEASVGGSGRGVLSVGGLAATRRLLGLMIAVALVVFGIVTTNWWVLAGGMTVLLFAQARRQGLLPGGASAGVLVSEVMLTDFSVLSASATLEDALQHARHSLQDIYPVVRGGTVVGSISRQAAQTALETHGNSYVQGTMTRRFETTRREEPLAKALARTAGSTGEETSSLIPVMDGEQIVGILTPEHLQRAMALVNRERARKAAIRMTEDRPL